MVAQSPEPGAHDKNAQLFTVALLLTIIIFAKINSELKYKIFLRATSSYVKNLVRKYGSHTGALETPNPFERE